MRFLLPSCIAVLLSVVSSHASAHLISAGSGSIIIQSDKTTLLVRVPVALFSGVDRDGDGLLQTEEIHTSRTRMIEQLEAAIQLRLGDQAGTVMDELLMVSVNPDQRKSTNQIEWLRFLKFPQEALTQPVTVSMSPAALTSNYILQVRRFHDAETAVLSQDYTSHTFLKNAWGTFLGFFEQGVAHILGGYDHVVFLLTLLTAAVSARRWLVVLTSFTLAHGVTYGLATFGVLQVSPQLIEPVIAFTIVLAAGVNLMGWRPALMVEAAAVFSFGLFHGLGFASSMAQLFKEQRFPLSSVLGFNVGVEVGQVAIAGLLALLMVAMSRATQPWRDTRLLANAFSWLAVVVGVYWFIERVWF